jgi:hypothetical protein
MPCGAFTSLTTASTIMLRTGCSEASSKAEPSVASHINSLLSTASKVPTVMLSGIGSSGWAGIFWQWPSVPYSQP